MTSWPPPNGETVLLARLEALARAGARRRKVAAAARNTDERRGEELQATFRRYVSPQLADRILDSSRLRDSILTAADIRTHAVIMFADLRGFTAISERLSPHEVVPLLNEYFSLLTEITFQHEGTVFHMAGDCLMVGFGVPFEQNDSAQRAVRAAQEMLDRFAVLAEELAPAAEHRDGAGDRHQRRRCGRRQRRLRHVHELHHHRRCRECRLAPVPARPRRAKWCCRARSSTRSMRAATTSTPWSCRP